MKLYIYIIYLYDTYRLNICFAFERMKTMIKFVILGFLMDKELTGYDIKQIMIQSTSNFMNASLINYIDKFMLIKLFL